MDPDRARGGTELVTLEEAPPEEVAAGPSVPWQCWVCGGCQEGSQEGRDVPGSWSGSWDKSSARFCAGREQGGWRQMESWAGWWHTGGAGEAQQAQEEQ